MKRLHAFNVETVRSFKVNFFNLNNRYPLNNEIIDNLGEQISPDIIKRILVDLDKTQIVDKIPIALAPSMRVNSRDVNGEENV